MFALSQCASVVALVGSPYYRLKFLGLQASFFDTGIQIAELGLEKTAFALAHAIAEGWCGIAGARADLLSAAGRNIVQGRDPYRRLRDLITRDDVPGTR
ncbi:hypothetical protein ACVWXN_001565 [Bradyrhizobium sp. i1.4.4]|uniref:hypothetical protein n=1 Tax=Bradyrhizobium sp. RT10b TaxID=3156331 RepID=UPI0033947227